MRRFAFVAGTAGFLTFICTSGALAVTYTQLDVFGDSTVDGGWWAGALQGQCGPVSGPGCATGKPAKDANIQAAINAGGTGAPVGVGEMNTAILASMLGLSAKPANQPGGTNYAISGSLDAVSGGLGNLNPNPNLPSTVQQIANYLTLAGGNASPTALYLVSSGGNDIAYAQDNFTTLTQKEAYLAIEASLLAGAMANLQSHGAEHFLVYNNYGGGTLSNYYNQQLSMDLVSLNGVTIADISSLVKTVEANPISYGFTPSTVLPGVAGAGDLGTSSACVAGAGASGWGQFCGDTTVHNPAYAHLRTVDAEQTSFFSDDQHFSAAGQLIEANYVFGLLGVSAVPEPST